MNRLSLLPGDRPECFRRAIVAAIALCLTATTCGVHGEETRERLYSNQLTSINNPQPILGDYPQFVEPIHGTSRYEAPILVDDAAADLSVRAWRTQFNARGIIESPNQLNAARTAIIVVHPWGINDGQGLQLPEPAGFAFASPAVIRNTHRHLDQVVNPFLKSMRGDVRLVMYSLPRREGSIRRKLYRSFHHRPTANERRQGRIELSTKLKSFNYSAGSLPKQLSISRVKPVQDYFRQFNGGMFGDHYNGAGYWDLPIPVHSAIDVDPDDVVIYDGDGYAALKTFLKEQGIAHVLLCGYSSSKCFRATTAGYENLRNDFNVFLVGDATLDNRLMVEAVQFATTGELAEISRENLITQVSWVRLDRNRRQHE